MMACRAAGINIGRTSQLHWAAETRVPACQVQPGDLVFFARRMASRRSGHAGLVIGDGKTVEACAPGVPVRVASCAGRHPAGFTHPWAQRG